jgi:sterol desaturase/sphingolipid hydroxylase (fatty acid hydroxylase superfamily)
MFLLNQIIAFFSFEPLINAIKTDGYHSLLSVSGFIYATAPVIPLLLTLELLFTVATRKSSIAKYKVTFAIYVINLLVGKIIVLDVAAFVIAHLEKYAPIHTDLTWYWFAYAYVVWELGQFIYHYASHKVRLLWCAHAPHHAVEHMDLSVSYAAFFLQGPVAYAIRTSVCMLLGVTPVMMAL